MASAGPPIHTDTFIWDPIDKKFRLTQPWIDFFRTFVKTSNADGANEAALRAAADDAEALARAAADTIEATTRSAADTVLQANITAEAALRAAADVTLQANIDAEATTRGNADTVLQGNIDALKFLTPLFDHFVDVGNVGTGEDDLYSDTIAAGQLNANGAKIEAFYSGIFVASATATREIKAYFGGTLIFDSTALAITATDVSWELRVRVIRVSASIVRCSASFITRASVIPEPKYTEITGLTLANTQVLKITGESAGVGAATGDVLAKLGNVAFMKAA